MSTNIKYKLGIICLLILFIVVGVNAACPEVEQDCISEFNQNPNPENFNNLKNPTAENLEQVQNPSLENFQYLLQQNPAQAGTYLGKKYNNEFAVKFFEDSSRIGLNPEVDDKYFSGENKPEESRQNIVTNKGSAEVYFMKKYAKKYFFDKLEDDFAFSLNEDTFTNGGKIINLKDFQDKPEVKSITAVAEGFVIELEKAAAEGAESVAPASQKVSIGGTGAGTVSYKLNFDCFFSY